MYHTGTTHRMSSSSPVSISEIEQKLVDKRFWLAKCIETLQALPREDKPPMWDHCTILRSHIDVLENMERLAHRGVRVSRERIYWEEGVIDDGSER